jgi:putative SOS response-associated peptidase YedK
MCGRTFRISNGQRIREQFGIIDPADVPDDYPPSWNIAPITIQPVVRFSRDTHDRELVPMRWGLVPYWILLANSGGTTEVSENETFQAVRFHLSEKPVSTKPLARRTLRVRNVQHHARQRHPE